MPGIAAELLAVRSLEIGMITDTHFGTINNPENMGQVTIT
jgi:hypothetical protein